MIFLCLSPVFIAVNIYYIYEIFKWLTAIEQAVSKGRSGIIRFLKIAYTVGWSLASAAIFVAFLLPSGLTKESAPFLFTLKRVLKLIGNYHLGVFIYMGMALFVIILCRLFEILFLKSKQKKVQKDSFKFNLRRSILGFMYVSFVVFITLYGVHNAGNIRTNRYEVTVKSEKEDTKGENGAHEVENSKRDNGEYKGSEELKIVLVADLHLGYNIGCRQMERMVSLINAEKPDLVVIAGDIFDNEYESLDDPKRLAEIFSSIESTYGTYAVYGNHDIDEKIIGGFTFNWDDPNKSSSKEMDEFLKAGNITLLRDEFVRVDDRFYLYGRLDFERPGTGELTRKSVDELASEIIEDYVTSKIDAHNATGESDYESVQISLQPDELETTLIAPLAGTEGAGAEGAEAEGAGTEGVGAEGAEAEGAGTEGVGAEGAETEGAETEGTETEEDGAGVIESLSDIKLPVFVLDHEPRELEELSEAGVVLTMGGHTHDGQFFPINLTSRYLSWVNSAGLMMEGDMASIVTSGVGVFGPYMRIGTQAEICAITVNYE